MDPWEHLGERVTRLFLVIGGEIENPPRLQCSAGLRVNKGQGWDAIITFQVSLFLRDNPSRTSSPCEPQGREMES